MTESDPSKAAGSGIPEGAPELFTQDDRAVETCCAHYAGPAQARALNAFHSLRRAWRLLGVDDEMAVFRAILAEEEAAASVFLALQAKGYRNASLLKRRNHLHKAAAYPFLAGVGRLLSKMPGVTGVSIVVGAEHRVRVRFDANALLGLDGEPRYAEPDEPLNFFLKLGDGAPDFASELETIAAASGRNDTERYLTEEANFRNRLLYANDRGIERVTNARAIVLGRKRRVIVLSLLRIAIEQSPACQPFATQCLQAFLKLVGCLTHIEFDFPELSRDTESIEVHQAAGERPIAKRVWRWSMTIPISYRFLTQTWIVVDANAGVLQMMYDRRWSV